MVEWLVSYSGGQQTIRVGSQWHQWLTDSTWEVVEPAGRSFSPSGLGGCLDFWCKPVGELRDEQARRWVRDYARADGCVEFCGDSIAAGLIADGVLATPAAPLPQGETSAEGGAPSYSDEASSVGGEPLGVKGTGDGNA